jgi:DNA-binding NtrC family response regulator
VAGIGFTLPYLPLCLNERGLSGRAVGLVSTLAALAATPSLRLRDVLAETERRVIQQALAQEKWGRTEAARVLGISRRQLFDKVRQYGLHP